MNLVSNPAYTAVIIDDEALARVGLRSLIDWERMGFTVVGEAENGEAALELITEYKPDVAFVDIRMPVLSGVELMQKMADTSPQTQIVVLSSYDEFAYAREALKYGALDYLLKLELTPEQILDVLGRAKAALEAIRGPGVRHTPSRSAADSRATFAAALAGRTEAAELKSLIGSDSETEAHYALAVRISAGNRTEARATSVPEPVSRMFIEIVENDASVRAVEMKPGVFGVVVTQPAQTEEAGQRKTVKDAISRSRSQLVSYFEVECTAAVCGPVSSITDLPEAYARAYDRLLGSKVMRRGSVQFVGETPRARLVGSDSEPGEKNLGAITANIVFAFHTLDMEAAKRTLSSLVETLRNTAVADRNALTNVCTEVIHQVEASVRRVDDLADLWGTGQPHLELQSLSTIDDFAAWIEDVRDRVLPRVLGAHRHPFVESATALVRTRYRENLTLEDVATYLGTSPSYLSRLFRRELGTTFGELLTSLRLAHATKLLEQSDVSIQSIAERVGYESGYYFSRVFKRHSGATPTEYRRVHRQFD